MRFRLLWDNLLAGLPVAAYVKNMAADGSHYWVMACVVPCGDGFLSVRLKPTSPLPADAEPHVLSLRRATRPMRVARFDQSTCGPRWPA